MSDASRRRAEFEAQLQPLLNQLYGAALGFLRHPQDAEDAVAETVARAYRAFDRFQPGTNFKAWVFRILTNHCINRHRHNVRGPDLVAFDDLEREAEMAGSARQATDALPDESLLEQVLDEEVEAALQALPLEYRSVVILSDIQEFAYQDIADMLGIPIGTVRSRLFRGRRLLRGALERYALERGLIRESDRA